ncbi:MAG: response regulator [Bacteroidetes bacterium]|nr:response regulator [Bacteroidota bacterium]
MVNKKKIVLIEDDEGVTRLIQFKLAKEGYEIVVFPNGENVANYLLTNKVSLVISDVMMPVVDGLTILKQIKSTPEIADIPVILLSTYSHESIILEGLRAGAADYITKPFSTSELLMRIQKALLK